MQAIYKPIIKAKRNTANTRHTDSLNYSYFSGRGLTTHTHKPKRKENGDMGLPWVPLARASSAASDSLAARPRRRWLAFRPSARASSAAPKAHKARSKAPTPTAALSLRRRRTNQAQQRRRRTNFHTTTTNEPGSDTTTNQLLHDSTPLSDDDERGSTASHLSRST